jgi:parallel beta-helix repeat protein
MMNNGVIYKKWLNMIFAICCIIIISIPFSLSYNLFEGDSASVISYYNNDIRGIRGISIYIPKDYSTIQKAIDNASSGDTIFVAEGTYYENIIIDKSISLIGNNSETTILNGNRTAYKDVIHISENWVNVTGFRVLDAGYSSSGIELSEVSNVQINNCTLFDNEFGIVLYSSNSNRIFNIMV